jgi:hypothetical protein
MRNLDSTSSDVPILILHGGGIFAFDLNDHHEPIRHTLANHRTMTASVDIGRLTNGSLIWTWYLKLSPKSDEYKTAIFRVRGTHGA